MREEELQLEWQVEEEASLAAAGPAERPHEQLETKVALHQSPFQEPFPSAKDARRQPVAAAQNQQQLAVEALVASGRAKVRKEQEDVSLLLQTRLALLL